MPLLASLMRLGGPPPQIFLTPRLHSPSTPQCCCHPPDIQGTSGLAVDHRPPGQCHLLLLLLLVVVSLLLSHVMIISMTTTSSFRTASQTF
jgi:hypothetical protein